MGKRRETLRISAKEDFWCRGKVERGGGEDEFVCEKKASQNVFRKLFDFLGNWNWGGRKKKIKKTVARGKTDFVVVN